METVRVRREFPRGVRTMEHAWIGLPDGCRLAARIWTWGPFVFVNPDADAAPVEDALGDLPDVVRDRGLDVGALRFHHRAEYEIRGELEDRDRELPRVLPLQAQPPGVPPSSTTAA